MAVHNPKFRVSFYTMYLCQTTIRLSGYRRGHMASFEKHESLQISNICHIEHLVTVA